MAEKEERRAVTGDEDKQRRWRKAYWLVHSYLDQKALCEQCQKELDALPTITWQDAVDSLTGGGPQFTERVQTSNLSDPTARAALNVDREIERLNREMRDEFEKPRRAAERNLSILNTVFLRIELSSKRDASFRDTFAFVLQFCKQGVPLKRIKDHAGKRMSRYRAKAEMLKVVEIIEEELEARERAMLKNPRGVTQEVIDAEEFAAEEFAAEEFAARRKQGGGDSDPQQGSTTDSSTAVQAHSVADGTDAETV